MHKVVLKAFDSLISLNFILLVRALTIVSPMKQIMWVFGENFAYFSIKSYVLIRFGLISVLWPFNTF